MICFLLQVYVNLCYIAYYDKFITKIVNIFIQSRELRDFIVPHFGKTQSS